MVGLDKMTDYTEMVSIEYMADQIERARDEESEKWLAQESIILNLREQVKEYDNALEKLGSSHGGWLLFYSNPNRSEVLASTFASSERTRIKALGEK